MFNPALVGASLAAIAKAAQPGAPSPVEAPMRELQWGKLNFLHTTDTHGWHGGHLQEPQYSADWGDYISFAEHLRARADAEASDLLLVDTGDRVEGNGLYDASNPQGTYTHDFLREQTIDIICTGNHELYVYETAAREYLKTVPNFRDKYIASNLDYIVPETGEQVPMAQRYKRFRTKNQGIEIVAFGFLFDFTGNANNTIVKPIEEVVEEDWFLDAISIRTQPDLYVVIGHVGVRMEEFQTIFRAIRKRNWFAPIAFFGGHHHVRDATSYDSRAFALASGRYFETIGFMSIDGITPAEIDTSMGLWDSKITFNRRYIDNNLFGLHYHTGLDKTTFPTEQGRNVSQAIAEAREGLDLDHTYGCAPKSLWMTRRPFDSEESIYQWLSKQVLPGIIVNEERKEKPRLVIMNTGAIRFDIFQGPFTRDSTYIVSPFKSGMNYIPDVPYEVAKSLITLLNYGGSIFQQTATLAESEGRDHGVPDPKFMGIPQQWSFPEGFINNSLNDQAEEESRESTFTAQKGEPYAQKPLLPQQDGKETERPSLIGGYTTKDDISEDGDDTIHMPLNFHFVPNCIQAEINFPTTSFVAAEEEDSMKEGDTQDLQGPEMVDLVFMDFIQPWILLALKFAGGAQFEEVDVGRYMEETFTEGMVKWIQENWGGEC